MASIGVLKHVARHVSGQQCESYLMKVARLRLKVARKRMRRTEVFETSSGSMHKCQTTLEDF